MDIEARLRNRTHCEARAFVTDHFTGREVVVIVAKMSYRVSAEGVAVRLEVPRPVRLRDEHHAGGPWASLRYPSDVCDYKPGTDVLLLGTAAPPAGATPTHVDVSLRVLASPRPVVRRLRVHGRRVYYEGALGAVVAGPAAALRPTPLVWELAFGGRDESPGGPPLVDTQNPAGLGVARDRRRLVGSEAHRIEDPEVPGVPAGFGPVDIGWEPRRSWAGTRDADWSRRRAPLRPSDFDPRHHCTAPAGQWCETPLVGDECVEITGVRPEGPWRFRLPAYAPSFRAVVAGQRRALDSHLDTYLVDADAGVVELCWRASLPVPRRLGLVEALELRSRSPLPPSALAT